MEDQNFMIAKLPVIPETVKVSCLNPENVIYSYHLKARCGCRLCGSRHSVVGDFSYDMAHTSLNTAVKIKSGLHITVLLSHLLHH
jgi:hydrogenase maturation factor HypF (carbamoyltransferase family)